MASEQRGILYEAMIFRGLESLGGRLGRGNSVFWNETPSQMGIDTDITVGKSADSPAHLFLVSHCTAEHNSDMKFWRNIGEAGEAHAVFSPAPKTVCVLFDARFKKNLLLLQPYAFDDYVDISSVQWGKYLIRFANQNHGPLPKKRADKLGFLETHLKADKGLRDALKHLSERLGDSLVASSPFASEFWLAVNAARISRTPGPVPGNRTTTLRRGLAKMLFFDTLPTPGHRTSELSKSVKMTKATIRGALLSDLDVLHALRDFDRSLLSTLHAAYRARREFVILVDPLRAIDSSFDKFWSYITTHWKSFLSARELFEHFERTHSAPERALGIALGGPFLPPGWLLMMLITLLKAAANGRTAFGYSKIVNAIDALPKSSRQFLARGLFTKSEMEDVRNSRTIEYGMRDWLYGDERQNFTLQRQELLLIAGVMSSMLAAHIGRSVSAHLSERLKQFFVDDTIETKLVAHPGFRPLKDLLLLTLDARRMSYDDVSYYPSPLTTLAARDGKKLNVRAGSTNVILTNKTLIRWISATDEGRTHKCKEFCGRAWGLRVGPLGRSGKLGVRPEVAKTILLVDGTFDQSELAALSHAGWDEIFYPDEMEKLVKAIV